MFRPRIELWIILGALALATPVEWVFARSSTPEPSRTRLCATLENLNGDVQVLDSGRTRLLEALPGSGIPCGAWINVGGGTSWASVRHRDGQTIHASQGTFVEVPENDLDGKNTGDQFVLYRGQVFGRAESGGSPLRIQTANARIRIPRGIAIVLYSQAEEETQLVALEGKSSIENRFVEPRPIEVSEGEASSLNFKLLRTVPTAPRAVAVADLRSKLLGFPIDDRTHSEAVSRAFQRASRKFASIPSESAKTHVAREPSQDREDLALDEKRAAQRKKRTKMLNDHLVARVTGGAAGGSELVSPHHHTRSPASSGPAIETDTEQVFFERKQKAEEAEKKRLLEELSRVHSEDE